MELLIGKLALIGALGTLAQWLAWRARLPAIVLLLAAGFVAGPVRVPSILHRTSARCCGRWWPWRSP